MKPLLTVKSNQIHNGSYGDMQTSCKEMEILRQRNSELEQLLCEKFHDMKNPLVTIKAYLVYLEHDLVINDRTLQKRDIHYIRKAADKVDNVLNDVLNMSYYNWMSDRPALAGLSDQFTGEHCAVAG
jgi:light-regulated signal transduction histidine kinase (bacteriophytochrome)